MVNTTNELSAYPLYKENENDPEVIRSQITRTRTQMSATVDQIQARLAPERLKQDAQDAIREATLGKVEEITMSVEQKAKSWRSGLTQTIRENPVPAALVGIGLGWLLMSNKEDDYSTGYQEANGRHFNGGSNYRPYYAHFPREEEPGRVETARMRAGEAVGTAQERVGEVVGNAQERVGEVAHDVQERATSLAHDAREQVRNTADNLGEQADNFSQEARARAEEMRFQARMSANRAKRTFSDTMEENPMAVAAAALAAGALVGMVLPGTPAEARWMGEASTRVMDEAKTVARDTAEKVKNVAQQAERAVVEEVKIAAEEEGLTSTKGDTSSSTRESQSSS